MAIMEALSWIKALNIHEVHIFADAEVMVQYVTTDISQVRWENNQIIKDIKTLISSFKFCRISHVRRDFNNIADNVAKQVRRKKLVLEEYQIYFPWFSALLNRLAVPRTS